LQIGALARILVSSGFIPSQGPGGERGGGRVIRKINQLSAAKVKHTTKPGRHGDGAGLYLEISTGGGKSWVFMWKRGGKRRAMGLGSAHTISLVEARRLAKEKAEIVNDGRDPIAERKEARARAITFAAAAVQCHADIGSEWRSDRYRAQWLSQLTIHTKRLANKMVSEITTDDVEGIIRPLWSKTVRFGIAAARADREGARLG
jgi:hypothetical protein